MKCKLSKVDIGGWKANIFLWIKLLWKTFSAVSGEEEKEEVGGNIWWRTCSKKHVHWRTYRLKKRLEEDRYVKDPKGGIFWIFFYFIQHCLICRPSDSEDPGIGSLVDWYFWRKSTVVGRSVKYSILYSTVQRTLSRRKGCRISRLPDNGFRLLTSGLFMNQFPLPLSLSVALRHRK